MMEFGEKLHNLRKSRGLTQEELAEALFVSRTAVSKWESGRGYPSIDSLKEISNYFSVSIDDLLSGEKLISIAEKENKSNIRNMCNLLFGMVDVFSFLLIILPLYSKTSGGYVYSVNLFVYAETAVMNRFVYWGSFIALILIGLFKIIFTQLKVIKGQKLLTFCSLLTGVTAVLLLALAREPYAVVVMFLLTVIKGVLLLHYVRNG